MSEESSESDIIKVLYANKKPEQAQTCEYCDKPFETIEELKIHMISHNIEISEDEVAICDHCTKVFDSMKSLNFHINDAHRKEETKKVESPMNKTKSKDFEAAPPSLAQSKKQVLCEKLTNFTN